ncbi:nicastrin-like [Glandiceps talaboti]
MATFNPFILQVLLFLLFLSIFAYGRKTHDMIYIDVKGFAPCVRRLNATHQIGCTSAIKGNSGVVHYINSTRDLDWLKDKGPHKPYIPIVTADMFTKETLDSLMISGKINGLMVIHLADTVPPSPGFSPDYSCPNANYGLYTEDLNPDYSDCKTRTWNPWGSGISFADYDFPIFALTNITEVQSLIQCYRDRNDPINYGKARNYPLCAVELSDRMHGAKDTVTCMRRSTRLTNMEAFGYCDPMGDHNVISFLKPTNKSTPLVNDSLIVVAAKLDSDSLFYDLTPAPGAENDITGFVTLLSVVETLSRLPLETKQVMKNIMFTFFQGESWDYIGSSRAVFDMEQGKFPLTLEDSKIQPATINLDHISMFLELRQLGLMNASQMWLHSDPVTQGRDPSVKNQTESIIKALNSAAKDHGIDASTAPADQPLPPASFQRFLRKENIGGVVITDHEKEFKNRYYQSRFDLPELLDADYDNKTEEYISPLAKVLNNVTSVLAQSLVKLTTPDGTITDIPLADLHVTNQLLYCFLYRPNCTLLRTVMSVENSKQLSNIPYQRYVGVYRDTTVNRITLIIEKLVAYFVGEEITVSDKKDCKNPNSNDQIYKYNWIAGQHGNGTCWKSFTYRTPAQSPAFVIDDWASTEYSTWTESSWASYSARMFYVTSRAQETVLLSIGAIVLLVSLVVVYFVNRKSDVLFSQEGDPY